MSSGKGLHHYNKLSASLSNHVTTGHKACGVTWLSCDNKDMYAKKPFPLLFQKIQLILIFNGELLVIYITYCCLYNCVFNISVSEICSNNIKIHKALQLWFSFTSFLWLPNQINTKYSSTKNLRQPSITKHPLNLHQVYFEWKQVILLNLPLTATHYMD